MPNKALFMLIAALIELGFFLVMRLAVHGDASDGAWILGGMVRVALILGFWLGSEGARLILLFLGGLGLLLNALSLGAASVLAHPELIALSALGLLICCAYLWLLNDDEVQHWMLRKALGGALEDDDDDDDDDLYSR